MEKPVIKASWFGSHDYCEYKWYLENVLKEEAPILKTMIVGKEIHQIKEYEFRKIASPATMKEFLDSKKYTITKEISLRKEFSEFILVGRLDELAVDENYIYVIDDKPKAKLWLGNKRQIWAYCILVKDLIKNKYPQHANKTILAVLRDRDFDKEVWNKKFEESDIIEVISTVYRILMLLKKKIETIPNKIPGKCRACVLHKNKRCEFSSG